MAAEKDDGFRRMWPIVLAATVLPLLWVPSAAAGPEQGRALPQLQQGDAYRTPLAGQGFRTEVFGQEVVVEPRDRRSVTALNLGGQVNLPEPEDNLVLPWAALYLWRHPDDDTLFRGTISVLYNDLLYAHSPGWLKPLDWVATFENFTVPLDQSELVDGKQLDSEQLTWGYVRTGLGLGWRRQTAPGNQENMVAVVLLAEPGYFYFSKGSDAAPGFIAPQDTTELRGHLRLRWDAMERNILELPHRGLALGGDAVYGYRFDWEEWGLTSLHAAGEERDYRYLTGYLVAAGGVPLVQSERHRLVGIFHGGVGNDLDRFSAPRVGGGPKPWGEEYGSTERPVLPGAVIREFFPESYAILTGEYRYEPIFFTYLRLRATVARLERLRLDNGVLHREDDSFAALGAGVTTGFVFDTRLTLDYTYNTEVIRKDEHGGHAVVLQVSKQL